jgi:hypothetical protein
MRKTTLSRYGVENVFSLPKNREIALKASISPMALAKKEATCRSRYGVAHPVLMSDFQAKSIKTNLERRGVENCSQDPEVFEKNLRSCYKSKTFTLPSGRVISLRGYEPTVLTELLKSGLRECDFEFDAKKQSRIWYSDPITQKTKRYYPDFYIPRLNWLIEVKSNWTLFGCADWWLVNKAKRKACIEAGYKFNFILR